MSAKKRTRVQVKSSPVTRVQAAAEFGRKKARQRRQQWKKRALMAGGIAFASYALVGGWWLMHTGKLQQSMSASSDAFWQHTADAGFRLDQITLIGRNHASAASVKAALGIKQGAPILAVSLQELKARLQAIPEIKTVVITRALPNELAITITERVPVAWWQQGGKQQLVDADGMVLAREKYKQVAALPIVVGDDAPQHVAELMALLNSAPSIKPDVVAAVRIGQRRWNVQLSRDIVVMLPESAPTAAWKRFATLVEKEALLSKAIRSVDMRMEDRVFIMPIEQKQNPITLTTARDT
ncbi:MAG: cell division protein FtsQ/DivIB [Pseudomonadota bacterium]